ncbi:MAG: aminopeptidase P N-terminal domain-containing protein, partial [Bdellovibrionales bacterium]|nr:aminopeptidase P N-terminal domain-containing protein [Bdellovibrionales bacterium]
MPQALEQRDALRARREAIGELFPKQVVLLAAGGVQLRNIPSVPHPFRPSSHFVHLFGMQPAGSIGVIAEGESLLFVPRPPEDDVLWHGAGTSAAERREQTGVDFVHDREKLDDHLQRFDAGKILSVPTLDPLTNQELEALIGRMPSAYGQDSVLMDALVDSRLVNDEYAISELRAAAAVTVEAARRAMEITRPGRNERELRAKAIKAFVANGAVEAFSSIITTEAEVLHRTPSDNELEAGELVLCDIGAELPSGYSSDLTRVWPVSGTFSPRQKELYEVVLEAQLAALALAKPGVRFRDLHLIACRSLTDGLVQLGILSGDPEELVSRGAHAIFFPHGLGHLIGLDVHDMEDLGDRAGYQDSRIRSEAFGLSFLRLDRDLQEGMAVTFEPGCYIIPALLD